MERARIEEVVDALPGEHLALGVLALDCPLRSGVERFLLALLELLDALSHGVIRHAEQRTGEARSY